MPCFFSDNKGRIVEQRYQRKVGFYGKIKKRKAVIAGVAAVSAASILTVRGIFHKVFARQEKEDERNQSAL